MSEWHVHNLGMSRVGGTAATAERPAARAQNRLIQVDGRKKPIRAGDIASISYGRNATPRGRYWPGNRPEQTTYSYHSWGRIHLKSGGTIACDRMVAENLAGNLPRLRNSPWRHERRSAHSGYQQWFSLDVVEAATERGFFACGTWHKFEYPADKSYRYWHGIPTFAQAVRKTFAGRDPRPIKIPTQEGVLICIPDVLEGPAGFDGQGRARVRIGHRVFTTEIQADTRRIEVAAREAFTAAWTKHGSLPALPRTSGRPTLSGVAR